MSIRYPTSRRVLDFIREYYDEHKIPPTMIEIGAGAGIKSTSTTYYHIVRLAEDGYIERIAGIARGLIPTSKKIDPSDFMQYKMKPKVNHDDPYGGDSMQVYDGQSKALKHAEVMDTSNPEQCLIVIQAVWTAGGKIAENMEAIPRADKEKLFDWLNDEQAFPDAQYTKQIEEIHEALGLELAT